VGGGCSLLLLSSSGGGWLFGVVAIWCRGRVSWLIAVVTAVVVGAIWWGGHSLLLCWVCCHAHLVVGSLLFSHSSAGEHLLVLIAVVGWPFCVVTS